MRPIVPVATHPALIAFAPTLLLTFTFAVAQGTRADTSGYWVGIFSSATIFTALSCTYASCTAAVSGGRARRAGVRRSASARSPVRVAWETTWPCAALAVVVQALGWSIAASTGWGSPGRIPWEVAAAWLAMISMHSVAGYLLGIYLPAAWAVPLALLGSYVWLGFTWAVEYIPLRYLSGLAISGCCAVFSDLSGSAPLTTTVFSVGAALVGLGLLASTALLHHRVRHALGLAGALAGVTVTALALATDLGPYPTSPRTVDDLTCSTVESVEVCLFPEQLWTATTDPPRIIGETISALRRAGVRTPDRVTGALVDEAPGAAWIVHRHDFSRETTIRALVAALIPQREEGEDCPRDDADVETMLQVADRVERELVHLANPHVDLSGARERASWINDALDALGDCSLPYPDPRGTIP